MEGKNEAQHLNLLKKKEIFFNRVEVFMKFSFLMIILFKSKTGAHRKHIMMEKQ